MDWWIGGAGRLGWVQIRSLGADHSPCTIAIRGAGRLGWVQIRSLSADHSPCTIAIRGAGRLGWVQIRSLSADHSPCTIAIRGVGRLGWVQIRSLSADHSPCAIGIAVALHHHHSCLAPSHREDLIGEARQDAVYHSFPIPGGALYGVFVVVPVLEAFGFALFQWRGISNQKTFVGLANFATLAKDDVFRRAVGHNLFLLFGAGTAILILSLAIAHALVKESVPAKLLRGVYLFPQVISLVVVAILWAFIYDPSMGY